MKTALLYFSGTGNTKRVGEVFKDYLLEKKHNEVDMIDISTHRQSLSNYDLLIAGTPTYTMTSSRNMNDFIQMYVNKTNNPKAQFITYVTHGWGHSYGHLTLQEFITKLGFRVIGAQSFLAPSNFYVYNEKVQPKQNEVEIRRLYEKITIDVKGLMDACLNGYIRIEKKSTFKKQQAKLISALSRKAFINQFSAKTLSVDGDKCTRCLVCVKKCPNKNIALIDGNIRFSKNCSACSRCMHICPQNAYAYRGKTFEQYNMNQQSISEQLK
ncbi:EFR1 family ferrodoxin [Anaeromicrobium sediminis]|uniref:4Fe-4S ferredoxin n=1 Tax=Anaeromicrobium sediminis TaxID=1478221 RepID=A0A267MLE7_9FIRM|nr:EFR1 family ferrodoxin [Anaeromicrobium sediminis]PAB60409.1 hypothetical protein CCE28_05810 [Anaeromicrobium sediminis]